VEWGPQCPAGNRCGRTGSALTFDGLKGLPTREF
jgi:hypothetical protein